MKIHLKPTNPLFKGRGFTIVELLITLVVLGILSSVALPNYASFMANSRLSNQNTALLLDFVYARGEAASRGARVTVCQSNDGVTCNAGSWGAGRIVFMDGGTAGVIDGTDEILRVSASISAEDTMSASKTDAYISYNAAGVSNNNLIITTCKSGQEGAKVTIYPSGRISKDTVGVCS